MIFKAVAKSFAFGLSVLMISGQLERYTDLESGRVALNACAFYGIAKFLRIPFENYLSWY